MSQNNISRLESEDYGKQTITSLKRVAEALDVALVVRLVPFSQYIAWLSETPYLDRGIRPEALAVPSFEDEERCGRLEAKLEHSTIYTYTPNVLRAANFISGELTVGNIGAASSVQQESLSFNQLQGFYQNIALPPLLQVVA